MRRKLAAGNWKMNGLKADLVEIDALLAGPAVSCEVMICPPATLIAAVAERVHGRIAVGGQDCHSATSGAHTGDLSAVMLADVGAEYVLVGHSERRTDHGETSDIVSSKASAALAAGLFPVVCVGETLDEREGGRTESVVGQQLRESLPGTDVAQSVVVAYEPVWAIGTGKVAATEDIGATHKFIRGILSDIYGPDAAQTIRILYGGSVKPSNAAEIFDVDDVDGALVGGASLKAVDFGGIIVALDASR